MTRRARLERKLGKRAEWAGKAEARAEQRFGVARALADRIPLGQPILVGHHSEAHARRDAERIHNNMAKGVEESKLADHHTAKAHGLGLQLERTVFSDDSDAIQKIEERIAKAEELQSGMKACNLAIRKHAKAGVDAQVAALVALGLSEGRARSLLDPDFAGRIGFANYKLTNNSAEIRRNKARLEEIKRRQARSAEASGGVAIEGEGEWIRVTFAEKPEREVLDALKAVGFVWRGGSWIGQRVKLPVEVGASPVELSTPAAECSQEG